MLIVIIIFKKNRLTQEPANVVGDSNYPVLRWKDNKKKEITKWYHINSGTVIYCPSSVKQLCWYKCLKIKPCWIMYQVSLSHSFFAIQSRALLFISLINKEMILTNELDALNLLVIFLGNTWSWPVFSSKSSVISSTRIAIIKTSP